MALEFLLQESDLIEPRSAAPVALFLGVALSISALPVINIDAPRSGPLQDRRRPPGHGLGDDRRPGRLAGALAPARAGTRRRGGPDVVREDGGLRRALHRGAPAPGPPRHRHHPPTSSARRPQRPGRVLSLVILLALFGAAIAQAIGLHAIFGGFIVGLTVGGSSPLSERTRVAIEDFVVNVFAPVFFASIGLRVEYVAALRSTLGGAGPRSRHRPRSLVRVHAGRAPEG